MDMFFAECFFQFKLLTKATGKLKPYYQDNIQSNIVSTIVFKVEKQLRNSTIICCRLATTLQESALNHKNFMASVTQKLMVYDLTNQVRKQIQRPKS